MTDTTEVCGRWPREMRADARDREIPVIVPEPK